MISKCFVKLSIIKCYRIWLKIWNKDDYFNLKFIVYPSSEKSLEEREGEMKYILEIFFKLYFRLRSNSSKAVLVEIS